MIETTCPQCATVNASRDLTPHSDNFCSECDFPLFWDQQLAAVVPSDEQTDDALRRLPGVGGRDGRSMRPCPECAEPNLVASVHCSRCEALLDPPPPPPPPEPEEVWHEPIFVPRDMGPDPILIGLAVLTVLIATAMIVLAVGNFLS